MSVLGVILLLVGIASASNLQNILLQLKRELSKDVPKDCGFKGDVVFLLDASSSIEAGDYELAKRFVKQIISDLDVKPEMVRIGLASFNQFAKVAFNLNKITEENMDSTQLTALVDTVRGIGRGTFTHRGLKLVREEMLTAANGARPGVPNVVIVITDGRANKAEETAKEALLLHDTGALVFAIAVGKWQSDTQLQVLASKPPEDFQFQVTGFTSLESIKSSLMEEVCKDLKEKPTPPPECYRKADLLFIMDASSSISPKAFKMAKKFIVSFLDSFVVSQQYLRVAAMTFDTFARIAFRLDTYDTSGAVKKAILAMTQVKTGTYTDRALSRARSGIFNYEFGDRMEEPNVIILITDGKSERPQLTADEATKTKDFGANILTVGIGNTIKKELETVSSTHPLSGKKFVFKVDQFDELVNITYDLVNTTCQVPEGPKKCDSMLDLMFVVDLSISLRPNFGKMKEFLKLMATGFSISMDNVRIGMITFNKVPMMNLKLSEGTDEGSVMDAIETLADPATGTMTWKALDLLRTDGFASENGGRATANQMAVIVTYGKSQNKEKTIEAATAVHEAGITTVVLTVGKSDDEESKALASPPTRDFLLQPKNFNDMFSFAPKLIKTSCAGSSKPDDITRETLEALKRDLIELERRLQ